MLLSAIGIIGSLSIVLGLSQYLPQLTINSTTIEVCCYSIMIGLIVAPHLNINSYQLSDSTKLLMTVLGLFALPFLETATLILHSNNAVSLSAAFSFIFCSTALVSSYIAYMLCSQFLGAYSILTLFLGLNGLFCWSFVDTTAWVFTDCIGIFNLILSTVFMSAYMYAYETNNLGLIIPFDKGIMILVLIFYFVSFIFVSRVGFGAPYNRFNYTTSSTAYGSYWILFNMLFVTFIITLYNFSNKHDLSVFRALIYLFGFAFVIAKYVDFPWADWSLGMVLFGILLWVGSILMH